MTFTPPVCDFFTERVQDMPILHKLTVNFVVDLEKAFKVIKALLQKNA